MKHLNLVEVDLISFLFNSSLFCKNQVKKVLLDPLQYLHRALRGP